MQYTNNGLISFGKYIHMVRGHQSLRDFANRTGLSHTTISLLEKAKHIPDWGTIKKLSPYVGLKVEQVATMINESNNSETKTKVIELMNQLKAEEKIKIVLSLTQALSEDKQREIIKYLDNKKTAD